MEKDPIMKATAKAKSNSSLKKNKLIFYIVCATPPLLQFCLFWFGTNLNSILLAFKEYTADASGKYMYTFVGFENFKQLFKNFAELEYLQQSIQNSLLAFVFTMLSLIISICFAYYITKKHWGGKVFQVLLFIPHIVSSIIMITMYKFFLENFIPGFFETFGLKVKPMLSSGSDAQTRACILFYLVWASFGTHTLLFCGSMNGISDSIFDATKIDGASEPREFISVVVPIVMPTIMTFVITCTATIFTNQMGLYSFFGQNYYNLQMYTVGYYLYNLTKTAGISGIGDYPYIATLGVCISLVTIPLVIVVRKCLSKIGRY